MHTIKDQKTLTVLRRLHKEAASQGFTIVKGLSKGLFRPLRPEDMKDAYIPISRHQGEFLFNLLVEKKAQNIIEFGTSFGISTLYLAAAARINQGKVITSEILPEKCRVAQRNFEEAGLADYVDLRVGDAMETLKAVPDRIDFLLLDGWNDLYLPLLQMLESKFRKGTLIYTDNASFRSARPFLNYLKAHPEQYQSRRLSDDKGGSELTKYLLAS
ncbi:MAG: class I SAM-dependent methyltransferase [Bacteroidota bacterium]